MQVSGHILHGPYRYAATSAWSGLHSTYMLGRVRVTLPSLGKPSPVLPDVVERELNPSWARSNRDVLNPPVTGLLVSE